MDGVRERESEGEREMERVYRLLNGVNSEVSLFAFGTDKVSCL